MEQIYYTQCPMGYGFGASNGFQIKRKTANYPASSDFRHLGLRAYPGGGRVLAPPTLRYRRSDDDRYDIALLSPRTFEYETEGGPEGNRLWGRPGGHFAHGVLLNQAEFDAIEHWPGGLYNPALWKRSDPVPTLTQPVGSQEPSAVDFSSNVLINPLDLWKSCEEVLKNTSLIARWLTVLVAGVRDSRTLFVIDEAERLAPLIVLLTWVFPRSLRGDLTFSTFHDRPEELPGFRIQGTTVSARPNKPILLTQGFVSDVKSGVIEPRIEAADWAEVVARWLQEGAIEQVKAWGQVVDRANRLYVESPWQDERFARAATFIHLRNVGAESVNWSELRTVVDWLPEGDLRSDWAQSHSPKWWRSIHSFDADARHVLKKQASWAASWKHENASEWGRVVAEAYANTTASERITAVIDFWKSARGEVQGIEFLRAIREAIPGAGWSALRKRLETELAKAPDTLAALDAAEAVASAIAGHGETLQALVDRTRRGEKSAVNFLNVIAAEVRLIDGPIEPLAVVLAPLFAEPDAFAWALRQPEPARWLGAMILQTFEDTDAKAEWDRLHLNTPDDLKPIFARAILSATSDRSDLDHAFIWAVEEVLLAISVANRPVEPQWPGLYIDKTKSDYQLITRIYGRISPSLELKSWIHVARERGELDDDQVTRLEHIKTLGRTLAKQSPAELDGLDLARIPRVDRWKILGVWLSQGRSHVEALLEACGKAWPESFLTGAEELSQVAMAIANAPVLRECLHAPRTWLGCVLAVRRCVQVDIDESSGMTHDGLVAHIAAWSVERSQKTSADWNLLGHLLNSSAAWKTIGEAFRRDLEAVQPADSGDLVEIWDRSVWKSPAANRWFWETILNICDHRRMKVVIAAYASALVSLKGPLSWWDFPSELGGVDDLRDAFARHVTFSPIDEALLSGVNAWISGSGDNLRQPVKECEWLSPNGLARWNCIHRLSIQMFGRGLDDKMRWDNFCNWRNLLKIQDISLDERYQLLAWAVFKIENHSGLVLEKAAGWLVFEGVSDLDRIKRWHGEIHRFIEISSETIKARADFAEDMTREMQTGIREGKYKTRAGS